MPLFLIESVTLMRFFKKKSKGRELTRAQAFKSIPIKSAQAEEVRLDNGEVLLTYPVKIKPWFTRFIRTPGGPSERTLTKKLQLDALGTEVWDRIDGRRSVQRVIQGFAGEHNLHRKEAEVAVTQFLRDLGKRGLIGLK